MLRFLSHTLLFLQASSSIVPKKLSKGPLCGKVGQEGLNTDTQPQTSIGFWVPSRKVATCMPWPLMDGQAMS